MPGYIYSYMLNMYLAATEYLILFELDFQTDALKCTKPSTILFCDSSEWQSLHTTATVVTECFMWRSRCDTLFT